MQVTDRDAQYKLNNRCTVLRRRSERLCLRLEGMQHRVSNLQRTTRVLNIPSRDATLELIELEREVTQARGKLHTLIVDALDHRYPIAEVREWFDRALRMGCPYPRVRAATIVDLYRVRQVPNVPFHPILADANLKAVSEDVTNYLEGRERQDNADYGSKGHDHRRFLRLVGLGANSGSLRLFIPYVYAEALTKALAIEPYKVGV